GKHALPVRAEVVGKAGARINIIHIAVDQLAGPGLNVVAHPSVKRQTIAGAPFVLNVKTSISVWHLAFGFVADTRRNSRALINRGIDGGLGEITGGIKALEEDDKGIGRGEGVGAGRRRLNASEISLKGEEERKRFSRIE